MRRKHWLKDLKGAVVLPNCTGYAVCFSRLLALTRAKLKLRFTKPSESQRSRSRFHSRNGRKHLTQNTAIKRRTLRENVDSGCLFVDASPRHGREIPRCWLAC